MMHSDPISSIRNAQDFVKNFAKVNGWVDAPNIDKFDHLHEELTEMSQHLRYKNDQERLQYVNEHKEIFTDGIGDLFFGLCRLANQLGINVDEAFNMVNNDIAKRYQGNTLEHKIIT